MDKDLEALHEKISIMLVVSPDEGDCPDELEEVYSDMQNLKESLEEAGYGSKDLISEADNAIGIKKRKSIYCISGLEDLYSTKEKIQDIPIIALMPDGQEYIMSCQYAIADNKYLMFLDDNKENILTPENLRVSIEREIMEVDSTEEQLEEFHHHEVIFIPVNAKDYTLNDKPEYYISDVDVVGYDKVVFIMKKN